MSSVDIIIERETANDDLGLVVAVHVKSGEAVGEDSILFDIENSKAVQEIWSTTPGILVHDLKVGQTVPFGVAIARIVSAAEWASHKANPIHSSPAESAKAVEPPKPPVAVSDLGAPSTAVAVPAAPARRLTEPRFSHAAAALAATHELAPSLFDLDFVTTKDVRARLGLPRLELVAKPVPNLPRDSETPQEVKPGRAVEFRKRAEIDALSNGAGGSMLSVLGITIGPLTVERVTEGFLNGRITDLVIYEAARLMKKFPKLNAAYADGQILEHAEVHAGLAIDSGSRLMVYGIKNADQANLHELGETMAEAIERYVNNALTAAELSRATFTVTDLSADELDFVFPLLPRGQSCILGITHSVQAGFRIYCGFDHRVTEGREAGVFLRELRDRLLTFAAADSPALVTAQCHYCSRSAHEVMLKGKEKGLLKISDKDGHEYLCCASCWNGW